MSTTYTKPLRILCYGDSLTAGTSPHEFQEFPYAPHLERALQESNPNILVRHRGLPGWTTSQLLDEVNGQRGLLTAVKAAFPIEIVILLAGTNDLGYYTPAPLETTTLISTTTTTTTTPIADSLIRLHRLCHAAGVPHTVAIGIPPSGYQAVQADAAQRAQATNDALARYCDSESKATYMPFPFGFTKRDDKWATDGLHLSPKGYQILGESLVPTVQDILKL